MKGISAILATVLIVVITIAIVGLMYGWATGLFGTVTETSEDETGAVTEGMQKNIAIIAATCMTGYSPTGYFPVQEEPPEHQHNYLIFTVKNTGTANIEAGELTAFINETSIDNYFNPYQSVDDIINTALSKGAIKQFRYESFATHDDSITYALKINSPSGSVSKNVICPAL